MSLAGSKFFFLSKMPPAESVFTVYTYITGFLMLVQTMLNQFVPRWIRQYVVNAIHHYFRPREKGNDATVVIEERVDGVAANEVYGAAETYLCTKVRLDIKRLKLVKLHRDPDFSIRFAQCETIPDFFRGIKLEWRFVHQETDKAAPAPQEDNTGGDISVWKYFELSFDKKYKATVLDSYVPFVLERAKLIGSEKKFIKLHTLNSASPSAASVAWDSINLEHPSTFETLAMEPELKESIIDDLDRFLRRKEFYRRVGRAWKRGYLLYGPPGTGKSSLVAAIGNYLKFDIYDLELANVRCDSYLRKLLLRTANRSILVIEDIDCTVKLPDRNGHAAAGPDKNPNNSPRGPHDQKFTLSGLLNFIDGLWSSCGDERIFIFTTNDKDKLDPALLRPGRMDMHIHMSYLTPAGFKVLASTYLNADNHHHHQLIREIEELIRGMRVTPAQVAEELMKKDDDAEASLNGLIGWLKCKKDEETDHEPAYCKNPEDDDDEESDDEPGN